MQAPQHLLNISIIGAGNVGHHLALQLYKAGYNINQICSRNEAARETASACKAELVTTVDALDTESEVYLLCIKDDLIPQVAAQLKANGKLLLHTSASAETVPVFTNNTFGVLYPLQTFRRNVEVQFENVPFIVNAENEEGLRTATTIAGALSKHVYVMNDEVRRALHVAAVFSNNFTNMMFTVAEEICKSNNLPFEILKPLISQTTVNALLHSPHSVQTGPAVRNDELTIAKHLRYLQNYHPQYLTLYRILTDVIKQSYKKNDPSK